MLALAPRLTEGVAAWRDPAAVASAVRGWVEASLDNAEDRDRAVLVAEDEGAIVGFCSLAVEEHWSGGQDVTSASWPWTRPAKVAGSGVRS